MASDSEEKVQTFYRLVRAPAKHPFAGLYAVEKLVFRGTSMVRNEIVKEWDARHFAEAALARYGGSDSYENFVSEHHIEKGGGTVQPRPKETIQIELKKEREKSLYNR